MSQCVRLRCRVYGPLKLQRNCEACFDAKLSSCTRQFVATSLLVNKENSGSTKDAIETSEECIN